MALTLRWDDGVHIAYNGDFIFFDLNRNNHSASKVFISHAHLDHSRAFSFNTIQKYSTPETYEVLQALGKNSQKWISVNINQRIKVGDLDVTPRNSGHVLGSALFEVSSPEATVVYTGDLNFEDTYTMRAAEPVPCDVLIIEATFGSPSFIFPPKRDLAVEMSNWAAKMALNHKIPVFKTDPLGNAQEIIYILNKFTDLTVISHWKVSRINRVYEANGYRLEYLDSKSEEAKEVMSSDGYVYVIPKGTRLPNDSRFSVALVSGWALWNRREEYSFAYSDHADYLHLLNFVEECSPNLVLTCFGKRFDEILAKEIRKKLHIEAYPLNLIPTKYVGGK